jgi:hypothetical protein
MTDTDAEPAVPAGPHKWMSSSPALTPQVSPAPAKVVIRPANPALTALQTIGACLMLGGLITMIVGITRTAPSGNSFLSNAADTITSAVQFASTSTLIVLIGAVAFLIGAMSLVGA